MKKANKNLKMNYKEYVEILINKGLVDKSSIHYVDESPYSNYFKQFYSFCIENIEINKQELGVKNIYIYSNKESEFNAISCSNGLITINQGVPIYLLEFFEKNKEIFNGLNFVNLKKCESSLDAPFQYLMFQLPMLFIYYHELAHQYHHKTLSFSRDFHELKEDIDNSFDESSHYLEIDADTYATNKVSHHIIEYNKRINKFKDNDVYQTMIGIFIASLTLTFFKFIGGDEQLYFKKSDHPHPMIRILICVFGMIDICHRGESETIKSNTIKIAFEVTDDILKNQNLNFNQNLNKLLIDTKGRDLFNNYIESFKRQMQLESHIYISMKLNTP